MSRAKNPELKNIEIPEGFETIESGSIRINDDWKALYLRGDNAMFLAAEIESLLKVVEENGIMDKTRLLMYTQQLRYVQHIIQNDVLERGNPHIKKEE